MLPPSPAEDVLSVGRQRDYICACLASEYVDERPVDVVQDDVVARANYEVLTIGQRRNAVRFIIFPK